MSAWPKKKVEPRDVFIADSRGAEFYRDKQLLISATKDKKTGVVSVSLYDEDIDFELIKSTIDHIK